MGELEIEVDEYGRLRWHPSYEQVIDHFGTVLHMTQQGSYSGDYFVVYDGGDGKRGWLAFGYGSCSGCDALQGCDTPEEVTQLVADLRKSIEWFASEEDLVAYLDGRYLEGNPKWWYENKGVTEMLGILRPGDERIAAKLEYLRGDE